MESYNSLIFTTDVKISVAVVWNGEMRLAAVLYLMLSLRYQYIICNKGLILYCCMSRLTLLSIKMNTDNKYLDIKHLKWNMYCFFIVCLAKICFTVSYLYNLVLYHTIRPNHRYLCTRKKMVTSNCYSINTYCSLCVWLNNY